MPLAQAKQLAVLVIPKSYLARHRARGYQGELHTHLNDKQLVRMPALYNSCELSGVLLGIVSHEVAVFVAGEDLLNVVFPDQDHVVDLAVEAPSRFGHKACLFLGVSTS